MSPEQIQASYTLWRDRESKALTLWRSRQKRLDQDDPRRIEAFRAYRHATAKRKRRAAELAALAAMPVTHMDAAGRAALIREEGVRRFAYNDSQGHATFGVGHLLHLGPVTSADRKQWGTPARPLSMRMVDSVLAHDLAKFERAVRDAMRGSPLDFNHAMFNALVSLAVNIGIDEHKGFPASTVVRQLHAGHKKGAADAFLLWSHPPELRPRRERERRMFLTV